MAGKKINTKSELSKTDVKIVIIVVIFLLAIVIGAIEFLYIYKPNAENLCGNNANSAVSDKIAHRIF